MTEIYAPQPPVDPLTKPALTWDEFWGVLGISNSAARLVMTQPGAPRFFLIGRRRFIAQADAKAWIEQQAQAKPYTPRKYKTRGGDQK